MEKKIIWKTLEIIRGGKPEIIAFWKHRIACEERIKAEGKGGLEIYVQTTEYARPNNHIQITEKDLTPKNIIEGFNLGGDGTVNGGSQSQVTTGNENYIAILEEHIGFLEYCPADMFDGVDLYVETTAYEPEEKE